ncbi:hypothetical protein [Pseudobdellovibrio sp. HCB154]|uniref:hypothetical protein n=1 Tax=Pseudobdellovibrio sp. HCB154 TaxID=3386277 RepID=UPI00391719C5
MLRIFCLIFSAMILFTPFIFADTGGDFGGGNEQGNASKSELCKKYGICTEGHSVKLNSLGLAVSAEGFKIILFEDSLK